VKKVKIKVNERQNGNCDLFAWHHFQIERIISVMIRAAHRLSVGGKGRGAGGQLCRKMAAL